MLEIQKLEAEANQDICPDYYCTPSGDLIDYWVKLFGVSPVQYWCFFSAYKYLYRIWDKDTPKENINKAITCLNRFLTEGGHRIVQVKFEPTSLEIELLASQGHKARGDAYIAQALLCLEEWGLQRNTESLEEAIKYLHKARWAMLAQEQSLQQ